jgi:hypothetical protein
LSNNNEFGLALLMLYFAPQLFVSGIVKAAVPGTIIGIVVGRKASRRWLGPISWLCILGGIVLEIVQVRLKSWPFISGEANVWFPHGLIFQAILPMGAIAMLAYGVTISLKNDSGHQEQPETWLESLQKRNRHDDDESC